MDAEYTVDKVAPAAANTALSAIPALGQDDKPQSNPDGTPVFASKNPNYLRPTSYQTPITGRAGLRIIF
jgi:hypothetical protein